MNRKKFTSTKYSLSYEQLEPRRLLAGDILVGNLNSGVAVSDTATGTGHIMYSEAVVHTRFSGVPGTNADHFIATRLDGIQWQYNNDANWIDFTPVASDLLVAELNFDSDKVARGEIDPNFYEFGTYKKRSLDIPSVVQTIDSGFFGDDLRFATNKFNGLDDVGEFQVLGSSFSRSDYFDNFSLSEKRISQIGAATVHFATVLESFPRVANYASDGTPLLSWRVHLLPFLGMEDLYRQFNLDEPWDSPNNLPLVSQMPEVYASPHFSSATETSFLAMTGTGTMFPEFHSLSAERYNNDDIPDGRHSTLMFVEADADRKVIWTKPGDLVFNRADPLAGLGSIASGGFATVTVDRAAYTIPSSIDPVNFANLTLRNDGNYVDFSEFAPYTSSKVSLEKLATAASNYESWTGRLPAHAIYSSDGTTPLLSWRVAILPRIEQNALYEQFHLDEPWDSPHNSSLIPLMPQVFAHPNVPHGMTNYLAVSGPGTVFELSDRSIRSSQILDGPSNTILFVEADVDQAVEWTRPQDWVPDFSNPKAGLGGILPEGFNVALANDSPRYVDAAIPDVDFGKMLTIAGNEVADFSFVEDMLIKDKLSEIRRGIFSFHYSNERYPKHGTYDEDGNPLLSWRVQILPFIEHTALYEMFHHDEPWDSPHNLSLLPLMPEIYSSEGIANGFTVFQGANGPDTMFPLVNREFGSASVSDGANTTALFMQVDSDRAIEWTRPLDLPFDSAEPGNGLGEAFESGFYFVTVDGKIHFYNNTIENQTLEFLLQKDDDVSFAQEYDESPTLINQSREIKRNLASLVSAAQSYQGVNHRLPSHAIYSSSGVPTLSWRVRILPFLGSGWGYRELYEKFNRNEPWDSPHNLSLVPLMPDYFKHPRVENGMTVFQAFTTVHDTGLPESYFPIYSGNSNSYIGDSPHKTFMFVETNIEQAVEWTKPEDIVFDPSDPKFGIGEAYFGIGNHVANGSGWYSDLFIPRCITPEQAAAGILRDDGQLFDHSDDCVSGIAATVAGTGVSYGNELAPDKTALRPGQTAAFENYTSFIDGITNVSVDIGRLPSPFVIGEDDFIFRVGNGNEHSDFSDLGISPAVTVIAEAGESESDRVMLEFPAGTITNTWLQVTVLANANTGLTTDTTFYFGNAIGETGNDPNDAVVNLSDIALARQNQTGFATAEIDNSYDIDRDGIVNLVDVALIRQNQSGFSPINLITAPGGSSGRSAPGNPKGDGANEQFSSKGLSSFETGIGNRQLDLNSRSSFEAGFGLNAGVGLNGRFASNMVARIDPNLKDVNTTLPNSTLPNSTLPNSTPPNSTPPKLSKQSPTTAKKLELWGTLEILHEDKSDFEAENEFDFDFAALELELVESLMKTKFESAELDRSFT